MIMWEVGAGHRAYIGLDKLNIEVGISLGEREDDLPEAPLGYMELIKECWSQKPEDRPEATEVLERIIQIEHNLASPSAGPSSNHPIPRTPSSEATSSIAKVIFKQILKSSKEFIRSSREFLKASREFIRSPYASPSSPPPPPAQ